MLSFLCVILSLLLTLLVLILLRFISFSLLYVDFNLGFFLISLVIHILDLHLLVDFFLFSNFNRFLQVLVKSFDFVEDWDGELFNLLWLDRLRDRKVFVYGR